MKKKYCKQVAGLFCVPILLMSCKSKPIPPANASAITPRFVSERVQVDSDDPAIWLHPTHRSQSLILGTDKGDPEPGALYVFDLQGRILADKVVRDLNRPNNVDVEYGLPLQGVRVDIAVTTQKYENRVRIHSLPEMRAIDNGGVVVFEGIAKVEPMGIALYKRARDGAIFMIVSRKKGPKDGTYLWQYRLEDDGTGNIKAVKVREFGAWSGKGEIEAIAVDDAMGYAYYADEWAGIRKYHADPEAQDANTELAFFGTTGFKSDREGISIYAVNDGTGYVIVSDQQANTFHFYKREGEPNAPHDHRLVTVLKLSTKGSDGSEVTNVSLSEPFENGLFVAMSEKGVFQIYAWSDLAGKALLIAPNGERGANTTTTEGTN
ncbi:phytase [candidate division KSB1 bacterium]|nr:phytase [candidate division KSB1 bacterium]